VGKSTTAKLIRRSYEFQSGELLVDNIRYGDPGASDGRVEAAARSLGRGDWVDDLPAGLATETGHRGSSLSMGQRQLVVLSRVLMRGRTAIVIAHRP
jgi:ATP-binding cassette, subfamily B, bacterial